MFKEQARKLWMSQRDVLEGWDGFERVINQLSEDDLDRLDMEMTEVIDRALNRIMSKMFGGAGR